MIKNQFKIFIDNYILYYLDKILKKSNLENGLIQRKPKPQKGEYMLGALSYKTLNKDKDWEENQLIKEVQKIGSLEPMSCTNHSLMRQVSAILHRMWLRVQDNVADDEEKEIVKIFQFFGLLDDKGYSNFSDRYNAKLSGTTKRGNNLHNPNEALRKYGLINEEDLPVWEGITWNEYYAPIPQELIDKGKKITEFIEFGHEWINPNQQAENFYKYPPRTSGYAWPPVKNGIYQRTENTANHAFLRTKDVPNEYRRINDTYKDWTDDVFKNLAWNYKFGYGKSLSIRLKKNLSLSDVLVNYEGKAVKGKGDKVYLIKNGKKLYIPNVETGWAFGVVFNPDDKNKGQMFKPSEFKELPLESISDIELNMIPDGEQLHFKEGLYSNIVNEVANHYYKQYNK